MRGVITKTNFIKLEDNHKRFLEYVYEKNVIFVAPGTIMHGRGLGEWIDSFDVVVRTNNFPVILENNKELQKDYGKRTDVLYCNMQYYNKTRPLPYENWKNSHIKWFCMKKCRDVEYRIMRKFSSVRVISRSCKYVSKLIKSPLMGSIILYDLSEMSPAKLTFTGMDFYLNKGEYKSYPDGYITDAIQEENKKLKIGEGVGHDLVENAKYIYDYYDRCALEMNDFVFEKLKEVLHVK